LPSPTVHGDEQVYVIPVTGGVPEAIDVYPPAGLHSSLGLRQSGLRLDPTAKSIVFAPSANTSISATIASTLSPSTAASRRLFRCPSPAPAIFSPMALKLSTPRSSAISYLEAIFRWLGPAALHLQSEIPRAEKSPTIRAPSRDPIVDRRKNFYSSDKDDTLNLYAYDVKSKKDDQLTHSTKWDVAGQQRSQEPDRL